MSSHVTIHAYFPCLNNRRPHRFRVHLIQYPPWIKDRARVTIEQNALVRCRWDQRPSGDHVDTIGEFLNASCDRYAVRHLRLLMKCPSPWNTQGDGHPIRLASPSPSRSSHGIKCRQDHFSSFPGETPRRLFMPSRNHVAGLAPACGWSWC
jgi:hypothetical protein